MTDDRPTKPYWTVSQVAAHWCVSVHTVYAAIRKGSLPAVRVGSTVRIKRQEAIAWGREISPN